MRPPTTKTFIIVLLIGLISLLAWYNTRTEPIKVSMQSISRGIVENTVTNTRAGTIRSCKRARLAPATAGQISRLLITEGDKVSKGDLLLEIWNDDIKAELLLAEEETHASQSKAQEACITAEVAEKEAGRIKSLRTKNLASQEDTERAIGSARAKRAACRAAQTSIQVSKARIKLAQAQLQRTQLIAPFAAIVAEVNGEVGEFATPSPIGVPTLPTVDLFDQTCAYVAAPIDEVDAPGLQTGMPARITLDAFKKQSFQGRVRRIAPYVQDLEKQARTVDIEVDFINKEDLQLLLPGYSADVEVIIETKKNVLRIPTEAIKSDNKVLIYNAESSLLEEKIFSKGISNWVFTEVLDGLSEGQRVVTSIDKKGVEAGVEVSAE